MKKNKFTKLLLVCCGLALFIKSANAQYLFSQSFANPFVLARAGWYVSNDKNVSRAMPNGMQATGTGSLKVGFDRMGTGVTDTLITPTFTPTVAGDSLSFAHAHRAKWSGIDSMSVFYSTNGGNTLQLLHTFLGDPSVNFGNLSTSPPAWIGGPYIPSSPTDWQSKYLLLPAGTNRLAFIFYSDGGDDLFLDNFLVGHNADTCTGTPTIYVSTATLTACSGSSLVIGADSFEVNNRISYRWQRSLDNGVTDPWTIDSTALGYQTAEAVINYNIPYYYRLTATCTISNQTATSASVHVINDSAYNCYCRDNLGGFCNMWISNVQIDAGLNLNNGSRCNGSTNNNYSYYAPGAGTTDTLYAGNPYGKTLTINTEAFGPWLTGRLAYWVDGNRSGSFDSLEFSLVDTNISTTSVSHRLKIPATTQQGLTGLRIRFVDEFVSFPGGNGSINGSNACDNNTSGGETEDYLVYVVSSPTCNGIPAPGLVNKSRYAVCRGESVTLETSGAGYGLGVTYQWETSLDSGLTDPWHAVTGASDVFLTLNSVSVESYYRMKVRCSTTNDSSFTNVTRVMINPFYLCYCNDDLGGYRCTGSSPYISNVNITNTVLNNNTTCSANPSTYTLYNSPSTNASVNRSQLITISATATDINHQIGVWIDFDRDSSFEATEFTLITNHSFPGVAASRNIIIPSGADTGYTGMRVRAVQSFVTLDPNDPCAGYRSGETEDYVIHIASAPTCSGNPVSGAYDSAFVICNGDSVHLEAIGASYGNGITYQWQESDDAGMIDPWSAVTTGTGRQSRIFTSAAITDTIYYRLLVTCTNSGQTSIGDTVMVTLKPFYECYCSHDVGGSFWCEQGENLDNVSFPGKNLNNDSRCNVVNITNNYTYFPPVGTATDTLRAGEHLQISAKANGNNVGLVVWIDYNHNGTYDAAEFTRIAQSGGNGIASLAWINVPLNAQTGLTGMRLRAFVASGAPMDSTDACTQNFDSETEDYVIYIEPPITCAGTPDAGSIPSIITTCANIPFQIPSVGSTFGTGITYAWEKSSDNGVNDPWTVVTSLGNGRIGNVSGLTNTMYYRLRTSCSNSSLSAASNVVQVVIDSFYHCYDATINLGGGNCQGNDRITDVSLNKTGLSSRTGCSVNSFGTRTVYPYNGNAVIIKAGGLSNLSITHASISSSGVWIDYNRNGVYDASEFTLISFIHNSNLAIDVTINVPAGATPGLTGMRIRTNLPTMWGGTMGPIDANTNFNNGETEDYVIMIDTLRPGTIINTSAVTDSSITLHWNRGNGDGAIVVATESGTTIVPPVDNTNYVPDNVFASGRGDSTGIGNYVVHMDGRSSDTTVTVYGLDTSKTYVFTVYEFMSTFAGQHFYIPGLSTNATTLPVELISFNGKAHNDDALLSWSTASEKDNAGFYVQRAVDGINYNNIGFVKGYGNSSVKHNYQYTDANALLGNNKVYYRLQQVDHNFNSSYSSAIIVQKNSVNSSLTVYPNPFDNEVTIQMAEAVTGNVIVSMTNSLGINVPITWSKSGNDDKTIVIHQLNHLPRGVYLFTLEANGVKQTFKMVH